MVIAEWHDFLENGPSALDGTLDSCWTLAMNVYYYLSKIYQVLMLSENISNVLLGIY